jgi:hypothetical protein
MFVREQVGDWHFAVRPSRNGAPGFIAWCAKAAALGDGPMDIPFDEEVHFAISRVSADEALAKLKRSVLQ